MSIHSDFIRILLARGPCYPRHLIEKSGISQPVLSRTIAALGDEILRIGNARSIRYALRDTTRGFADIPVHRVSADGNVEQLGVLMPVRPDGFVMQHRDGRAVHSDALPWWLLDMCPQGFLGRGYAARHAAALGLPARLGDWNDSYALRALLLHGQDAIGNLLLGDAMRDAFLAAAPAAITAQADKARAYVSFADAAARGELPGASAGGEQPKFVTRAETPAGPRHVIVKFTLPDSNPITGRWRDLLLAEHLALETLAAGGVPAVRTQCMDFGTQRFLEIQRVDRVGDFGRCALFSLKALDAEFVGAGVADWTSLTQPLAKSGRITRESAARASLLHAFGLLIGNADMHSGNLSFFGDPGQPHELAPAYDMLPMSFAPRADGATPSTLFDAGIPGRVAPAVWQKALPLARSYLDRLREETGFTLAFQPCLAALAAHIEAAAGKIGRLG